MCFFGGNPPSSPARSNPTTPRSRKSTASSAISCRQLHVPHGADDQAVLDPELVLSALETLQHGVHHIVPMQALAGMEDRGKARFDVHHAVLVHVLHHFVGDAFERLRRSASRHRCARSLRGTAADCRAGRRGETTWPDRPRRSSAARRSADPSPARSIVCGLRPPSRWS